MCSNWGVVQVLWSPAGVVYSLGSIREEVQPHVGCRLVVKLGLGPSCPAWGLCRGRAQVVWCSWCWIPMGLGQAGVGSSWEGVQPRVELL